MARGMLSCAKCNRQMKPKTNGVAVLETMNDGRPYKLWMADLFECQGCGAEVVAGFGGQPLAEHFHADFAAKMASYAPTISFGCRDTDYKRSFIGNAP